MSREDMAMRVEILKAKQADTFINREVIYVLEDGRCIHLPHMKYFKWICQQ